MNPMQAESLAAETAETRGVIRPEPGVGSPGEGDHGPGAAVGTDRNAAPPSPH